jgi:hypothetical protein
MAQYTTFVIPSDSPGGSLKVRGVNPAWGFTFLMSPSGWQYTTHFEFMGFDVPDVFRVSIPSVKTNMRINVQEMPGVTPTLEADGIAYTAVEHHLPRPHPGN